jgi:hypothetical protein
MQALCLRTNRQKKKGRGINTNETGERDTLKMEGKQKEDRKGKWRKLK